MPSSHVTAGREKCSAAAGQHVSSGSGAGRNRQQVKHLGGCGRFPYTLHSLRCVSWMATMPPHA